MRDGGRHGRGGRREVSPVLTAGHVLDDSEALGEGEGRVRRDRLDVGVVRVGAASLRGERA